MPKSRSFDEFSERLQIVLFTLSDPELNAVYSGNADVRHVPRELEVTAQGVGVPECEGRGGMHRNGHCLEAVMWYVHHFLKSVKTGTR